LLGNFSIAARQHKKNKDIVDHRQKNIHDLANDTQANMPLAHFFKTNKEQDESYEASSNIFTYKNYMD
jgi:hypothetical protein